MRLSPNRWLMTGLLLSSFLGSLICSGVALADNQLEPWYEFGPLPFVPPKATPAPGPTAERDPIVRLSEVPVVGPEAPANNPAESPVNTPLKTTLLANGIQAYRSGNYPRAFSLLTQVHQAEPGNPKAQYYLAMSNAQLRQFDEARDLYTAVLQSAGNAPDRQEAATLRELARRGLAQLPQSQKNGLDLPPAFQPATGNTPGTTATNNGFHAATVAPVEQAAAWPAEPAVLKNGGMAGAASSLPGGYAAQTPKGQAAQQSMDDWAMWQAMEQIFKPGGAGQPAASPFQNPYDAQTMPGMQSANLGGMSILQQSASPAQAMDPNFLRTMMMNQMMQGFGMDSSSSGSGYAGGY
ncbi:MAG: tetratricopeptide repeat protein [Candidatus Melainabacteria bacterium]